MNSDTPEYIVDDQLVQERNRRESHRMPPLAGSEWASIKIGSREFECEIIDESAGGYQVSGQMLPATPPTTIVELTRSAECHRLQVVWQKRVDGTTVHMGLQRLLEEELVVPSNSTRMIAMFVAIILGLVSGYLLILF